MPKPSRPQPRPPSSFAKALQAMQEPRPAFPLVSPRWLLGAAGIVTAAALVCGWFTLCFLYWVGNWQLLYHPQTAITRTPAALGISFDSIKFATTETGTPRLTGWWLPRPTAARTILYLHGADGNLSDTVDNLAAFSRQNLNVFALDYRSYGQSQPMQEAGHPSEKLLRQDAEWALTYLTLTRQIPARTVVVAGSGLGATVAAELAADHPEFAGVLLDQPQENAMAPVFDDERSHLVPSRWLIQDRYNLAIATAPLKIPSLWLLPQPPLKQAAIPPMAYGSTQVEKTLVWLNPPILADPHWSETVQRWLDDLPQK